ncbi:host cell division inhibitor Icd-like protein [Haemophilus sp. SZY H52]
MPYRLWLANILIILPVLSNLFTTSSQNGIISLQSQKTIAEPANSTYLHTAQSTPKACFFMRNIRTPKEYADFVFNLNPIILSMVACSGKGSPFAANRMWQFCRPLHVTAKACKLYAVTLKCLHTELRKMYQFIFALIRAPQIKIRLLADNEQQARSRFTDGDTLLFVGKINQNPLKKNRTFSTNGKNHSLPVVHKVAMISPQSEKVIVRREKLNLYKANDSTPLNRAFFVRNIRTPQNKLRILFQHLSTIYSSMVERNEPSMTGCLPCMAVSHLVTFYRPTVRSLAVVPENLYKDTAEMIYKFLCVNRTQAHFNLCVISLNSTTEEQARLSLSADYRFIAVVARINPQNNRTLAVRSPLSVNNHSLPKCEDTGSIESTTTIEGNRNPYQCGIFLPKIHSLHVPKKLGTLSYIEFAVQMISRNKAEFIRTNKASRSIAVVESVSHPFTGDTLTLTKSIGNPTMKIYPKNNRTLAALPTLSTSAAMEVAHA